MKNLLLTVLALFCIAAEDVPSNNMQQFIPDGRKTVVLTAVSTTVDLSAFRAIRLYSTSACIRRHLPTSSKGIYPSVVVQATTPTILGISKATPFVNLSGCVGTIEGM